MVKDCLKIVPRCQFQFQFNDLVAVEIVLNGTLPILSKAGIDWNTMKETVVGTKFNEFSVDHKHNKSQLT